MCRPRAANQYDARGPRNASPDRTMWGKNNEPTFKPSTAATPQPVQPERMAAPAPPPQPRATAAAVGKTTKIVGEIYSEEELLFDGEIEGKLEVRNMLTIGVNGKVKASVKAKELVVKGSINGNVEATDRISIMNGASIVGDVKTAGIVIEDGAYF